MKENKERNRHYGLRIGDIVEVETIGNQIKKAEVIEYDPFDNNRVILKFKNGTTASWVAELCKIITKSE